MIMDDFILHFTEQLEETEPTSISESTVFRDLEEWSSLRALMVIAMIDEEYNVEFTADDFKKSETIADIYNIVQAKA